MRNGRDVLYTHDDQTGTLQSADGCFPTAAGALDENVHLSQAIALRLLDGVLRSQSRMSDGTLRDTCIYSITAAEWPTVKTHLRFQLDKPR